MHTYVVLTKNPSCPGIAQIILQGVDGIPKYSLSVLILSVTGRAEVSSTDKTKNKKKYFLEENI